MGTMPELSSAIWLNAPVERSMELLFSHVGHSSATVTVTDLPLSVFVIVTDFPQRSPLP